MSFYKGYHKDSRMARYSHLDTKMINNFGGLALLKRQLESGSSVNEIKIASFAILDLPEEIALVSNGSRYNRTSICTVHEAFVL